jgi:hypothetical protein
MKTSIITLACVALVSSIFLACDNAFITTRHGCALKPAAQVQAVVIDDIDVVVIEPYITEWIEEQLDSGKNDSINITIEDRYRQEEPYFECVIGTPAMGEETCYCTVDGQRMNCDENREYINNWRKEHQRSLKNIPDDAYFHFTWTLFMTASEIKELIENEIGIAISHNDIDDTPVDIDYEHDRPEC